MSLLNKISGLALKAKDNVVAKTFISKDKRLEQSLSDHIDLAEIYFEQISTYGLPSHINVVAYDSVAGLLAVAGSSKRGYIKVFGKGISATIPMPHQVGIKYLQFRIGSPVLIAIDTTNTIMTIDLRNNSVKNVVAAPEIITCIEYCPGTDWLFLGYANGFIDVFDILQGIITQYQISDLLPEDSSLSHVVVDIKMHPNDLNTLLIAYESEIFVWSMTEKTPRKSFTLAKQEGPYRNGHVTCLAWSPSGARFIAGYDDGCVHVWDSRNDQKPVSSRKLLQTVLFTDEQEDAAYVDPIYQIAWYVDESAHKSYVIIAGGMNAAEINGLTLLEYELDNEPKEPKKQSILPLNGSELSHFLLIGNDPYYSMSNPSAIALVDVTGGLQILNLSEHGYANMKLPPSIEFLSPDVLNACYLAQIPDRTFRMLSQFTYADKETKYFPITGGVTGDNHVYRIESNDLLLTIHKGEYVKFWDASFTALRPLTHLTIRCLDEIDTPNAFLRCLDVNKSTGTISIGYNDGSVVLYKYMKDVDRQQAKDPKVISRNDLFINSCNETLKEISDLLEDMDSVDTDDAHNPFTTTDVPSDNGHFSPFTPLKREGDSAGFYAFLKISLASCVTHLASIDKSVLVVATEDGHFYMIDITHPKILFSMNLSQLDHAYTINKYETSIRGKIAYELEETDGCDEIQKKPAAITSLHFFNTYSPSKVMSISTQLFVGMENGHVYQFNTSCIDTLMNTPGDHHTFSLQPASPVLQTFVINLKGESQAANTVLPTPVEKKPVSDEEAKLLTKESSQSSSISDKEDQMPKQNTNQMLNSAGLLKDTSKRMAAIGKAEYRYQDDPHLVIFVSKNAANVMLSGYNVKLFSKEFKDETISQSQIVYTPKGPCLCLLFSVGKLAFFALPSLEPMLDTQLPKNCLISRLNEASISSDGRVIAWTGKYEMKQFSFVKQPERQLGESVIFYDPQRVIPPHPTLNSQRPTKKTWLTAVAGAFQKDRLTVVELDSLMGRIPTEDPNEIRRQKIEAIKNKAEGSKPSGPGGVFAELGNKMNERGERINELDQKFQEVNAASGDFLKAVRDYNERQARKKWWEF